MGVKWKYIRPLLMDEYYKVQMTMKEDCIEVIRCRLESSGEEAVEGLRASVLGNYLKYKDHIAKSQKCICYVVSRQVEGVPDPDENAMWFKVNGEVLRFLKVEFALVTAHVVLGNDPCNWKIPDWGWIYEALPEVGMEISGSRGDYQGEWPHGLKYEYEQSYAKVDISETEGSSFALKYIPGYEKSKGRARRMEKRQGSPPAEPSRRRASVDEIPYDASMRARDAESREDADVLAAAREASSREEAKNVAVEKRKRELDVISEEVTKKVKAEIQSPEVI
ncbi:hypothetical protein OROHE_017375 [Orobanche hederae]